MMEVLSVEICSFFLIVKCLVVSPTYLTSQPAQQNLYTTKDLRSAGIASFTEKNGQLFK